MSQVVIADQRREVAFSAGGHRYVVYVPLLAVDPLWRYTVDGRERIMPMTSDPIRYEGIRRQMLAGTGTARSRFGAADRHRVGRAGRIPRRAFGD